MPAKNSTKQTRFDAVFTHAQAEELEANYNGTWGVKRRILMALLCCSSEELLSRITSNKEAEVILTMAEAIADFHVHLTSGIELTTAALARLDLLAKAIDEAGYT